MTNRVKTPMTSEGPATNATERLQAIIDWADFALKNPAEFDSHGVRNLDGPVFDEARAFLAMARQSQGSGEGVATVSGFSSFEEVKMSGAMDALSAPPPVDSEDDMEVVNLFMQAPADGDEIDELIARSERAAALLGGTFVVDEARVAAFKAKRDEAILSRSPASALQTPATPGSEPKTLPADGVTVEEIARAIDPTEWGYADKWSAQGHDPRSWKGLRLSLEAAERVFSRLPEPKTPGAGELVEAWKAREPRGLYKLDTDKVVRFYEQDFYVLSNFSSFEVLWSDSYSFKTAEHCYHWLRFATGAANGRLGGATPTDEAMSIADAVRRARSAHDAFKIAQQNKHLQRADWNDVKVEKMRMVIRAKALQHEYVHRKLLATGDRLLVEDSWRDDFWGWGPNRDGQNMLGKLWMEVRSDLRAALAAGSADR